MAAKLVYRFTAAWCGPCKSLKAILDKENINIPLVIDVDGEGAKLLTDRYGIRSVPTITIDSGNNNYINITGATLSNHHKQLIKEALM